MIDMGAFIFLIYTSVFLGLILGGMALVVFHLSALVSFGIAVVSMIGLFLICLVFNSITYKPPE
jgi:hypothetical protein